VPACYFYEVRASGKNLPVRGSSPAVVPHRRQARPVNIAMMPFHIISIILLITFSVSPTLGHDDSRLSPGGFRSIAEHHSERASFRLDQAAAPRADTRITASCNFTHSSDGYWRECAPGIPIPVFYNLTPLVAEETCCSNAICAGFSFACDTVECATGSGYFKSNVDCGYVTSPTFQGYAKPSRLPVLPNVTVLVTPSTPLTDDDSVALVNVSFVFITGSVNYSTDWVGQVCVDYPIEDYLEFAPVNMFNNWNLSQSGASWLTFPVFRARCDFEFRFFRGKQPLWPTGNVLGVSNKITWAGLSWANAPFHTHLAFGGEDTQHSMIVSFTTNSTSTTETLVQVGTVSGIYDLPNATDIESTTYGAGDLCNAPANETSVDFWQWPGLFHHVTVRGLSPGTRYFVRPIADGIAGEEVTFMTGKTLGPEIPVTFASFGDMSVTSYVLNDESVHDTADGGPGAVGTALRLRARIDTIGDIDFITHYGDLGYAKGAIFLWDAWMAMMALVGSRVPYMVSVGNHEYDYHQNSANDPSGVPGMWRPSWWDGDVDSLGECGVGTEERFRSPSNGNKIFWYYFSSGSATIVTLSSEHDLTPGSPQGDFLKETLSSVNRSVTPWLIVSFHRMVYSLTGSEQAQQDGYISLVEDVFMEYHVDLVMNGHIHSSQRTCAVYNYTCTPNAPVYIISGSSGAMLTRSPLNDPNELVQFYNDQYCGFYVVKIANSTHMHLEWTRNSDGLILDDAWVVRVRG
jgi:hypothetical protein